MHSGAIQYGDPTIASCESDLYAETRYNINLTNNITVHQ